MCLILLSSSPETVSHKQLISGCLYGELTLLCLRLDVNAVPRSHMMSNRLAELARGRFGQRVSVGNSDARSVVSISVEFLLGGVQPNTELRHALTLSGSTQQLLKYPSLIRVFD